MSLSSEVINILDALTEKFGMAIDWTSSNVMPYLEQLCNKFVNYEIATSIFWLILGIICLFLAKWMFKKAKYCSNKAKEDSYNPEWEMGEVTAYTFMVLLIIIGVLMVATQIFDIITCYIFPEKILLREIKSIYQTNK